MKKILAIIALCIPLCIQAQDKDENQHRYVGLGVRASIFHISELPMLVIPPNRLLVNIDPIKYARVEVHFARFANSQEQIVYTTSTTYKKYEIKQNSTLLGGGVFGIYPVEKANFIVGARFSRNTYMDEDLDLSSGNPVLQANRGRVMIVSGVLGGEYHFAKWFSIGAEFSYVHIKDTYNPFSPNVPDLVSKTNVTESSLLLRFYPY